jgi:hypothetical protein
MPRVSGRSMVHIQVAVPHELVPAGMHMVHPAAPRASFTAVMRFFAAHAVRLHVKMQPSNIPGRRRQAACMGDLSCYRYHMWSVVCIPVNAECHVLQAFDLSSQSRVSSASTACVAVRQSTLDQSYPLGARPNQSWHDECCGLNRSTSDMHRLRIGQPSCLLGYPGQPNLDHTLTDVHRLGTPNVRDIHRGTSGYCSDRAPFRIVGRAAKASFGACKRHW